MPFEFDGQPLPQVCPGDGMQVAYLAESPLTTEPAFGSRIRFRGGDIATGHHCDDLLDIHRLPFCDIDENFGADLELFIDKPVLRGGWSLAVPHRRSRS